MVHRVLVTVSFVACALIVASFTFFAVDQMSGASSNQVAQVAGSTPASPTQAPAKHGPIQRFVDSAAKDLTYPFQSALNSTSQWANQLLLLVLGLAVYGVGLGYLARYSAGLT